jgi:hypothetical protein
MKQFFARLVIGALIFSAGSAFGTPQKEKKEPAGEIPSASKSAPANSLSGKVVETMNSGGYTYICLEKNGSKTWVAVPETSVVVGQHMSFLPGPEMRDFPSKSLNRTFPSIIFSSGALPQDDKQKAASTASHQGSKAAVTQSSEKINVEKATGADAYTVGDIFAQRSKLHKKKAVVKAKVVKVSSGIMGKNWIHLQDGTGDAAMKTNNLVVTSQDLPQVGDIVTMKGTIYKDKDFGAGYKYNVIMEEASIKR